MNWVIWSLNVAVIVLAIAVIALWKFPIGNFGWFQRLLRARKRALAEGHTEDWHDDAWYDALAAHGMRINDPDAPLAPAGHEAEFTRRHPGPTPPPRQPASMVNPILALIAVAIVATVSTLALN